MIVEASPTWRLLFGSAFGLQQRAALGTLAVRDPGEGQVAAARSAFDVLLDERPPEEPPGCSVAESAARLFAFAVGAAQRQAKVAVSERFHIAPAGDGTFDVALPAPLPQAFRAAVEWVNAALGRAARGPLAGQEAAELREALFNALRAHAEPGSNRFLLARSAQLLDIPMQRWDVDLMVFGIGARNRWLQSTITDGTPRLGVAAARHKHLTARLLRSAGLPGPQNTLVASLDEALEAARSLGFPVVVKPDDLDRGEGVTADLRNESALSQAWEAARKLSDRVLVEKHFVGYTHRVNVNFGQVTRIARKIAGVIGDGENDVAQLVHLKQQTAEYRGFVRSYGRELLMVDAEALGLLAEIGRDAAWVPPAGEYVRLRRRDNTATGATNQELDIHDPRQVHPDNLRMAADVARVLRLDIAGIDLLSLDLSKSWLDAGALVCEVNAQPQFPNVEVLQPVLRELVGGGTGRIPISLFVGPADPALRRLLVAQLANDSRFDGVSDLSGLHVRGQRVTPALADGLAAARALLLRRDVHAAACVMTPAQVVELGLPLDRWDGIYFAQPQDFTAEERALLATVRRYLLQDDSRLT
jgi:cyanophycin synthetase